MLCFNKLNKYLVNDSRRINDLSIGIYYLKDLTLVCVMSPVRKIYCPKQISSMELMYSYADKSHLINKTNCIYYIYDKFITYIMEIVDKNIIIHDLSWNNEIIYMFV